MVKSYLDASVVYSMLVEDDHSANVRKWAASRPPLAFSLWTITETSSALSHSLRTGRLKPHERHRAEIELERLLNPDRPTAVIGADEFRQARDLLAKHSLLRAPDALHLAIAVRESWHLATLDKRLAEAAASQGVPLALDLT